MHRLAPAGRGTYDPAPVNLSAMPYVSLILMLELAVGTLVVVTVFDARRMVTMGYVQMGSLIAGPLAILAVWLSLVVLQPVDEVGGYALAGSWLAPLRIALDVLLVVSVAHGLSAFGNLRRASLVFGALGSLVGLGALVLIAGYVSPPAWSFVGMLLSVIAGAFALGGSMMAMSWGHWYLTNSGLPKEPLEQMSLLVAGALAAQVVLLVIGMIEPVRIVPLGDTTFGVALVANPAFWLRVAIGLVAPLSLALLAYKAASIRGMMSATGLLYIAVGCVLAGEILARGLLFATGVAL